MPIVRQTIDIPITSGIDEKVDDKLTTKMISLQNSRQVKTMAVSRRYGVISTANANTVATYMNAAPTPPTPATAELLTSRGSELIQVGGGQLAQHRAVANTTLIFKDLVSEALVYRDTIAAPDGYTSGPSVAYDATTGLAVLAALYYSTTGSAVTYSIRADVIDVATGAKVISQYEILTATTVLSAAACVQICSIGSVVVIAFAEGTSNIKAVTVNLATLQWSAVTSLITNRASGTSFAICGLTSTFAVVWEKTASSGLYIVTYTSALGAGLTEAQVSADTSITTFAVHSDKVLWGGTTIYVAWSYLNSTYSLKFRGHSTVDLSATFAAQTLRSGLASGIWSIGIATKSTSAAFISWWRTDAGYRGEWVGVTAAGAQDAAIVSAYRMSQVSKPFYDSTTGRYYFLAYPNALFTALAGTTFLVNPALSGQSNVYSSVAKIVATVAPRTSVFSSLQSGVSDVVPVGGGRYLAAGTVSGSQKGSTTASLFDIRVRSTKPIAASIDNLTILSGGCPQVYDGSYVTELGFAHEPDYGQATISSSDSTGSLSNSSVYRYLMVYEWRLADGRIVRSPPSDPSNPLSNTTNATGDTMSITFPEINLTNKQISDTARAVHLVLYRTTSNGGTYYRSTSTVIPQDSLNLISGNVRTITDSTSDATLRTRPILYTAASLADEIPPSSAHVAVVGRRVWLSGTDDDAIWFSDKVLSGEAPKFSSARTISPFQGGRVMAVSYLNEQNVLVFKKDSTWIIRGDGPNSLGTEGDFTEPERISSEVGCTVPSSIVVGGKGCYFQSRSGIARATGQGVEFVGKSVEDSLGAESVTSATYTPDQNLVRFTLGTGSVLTYDEYHGTWSTDVYLDPVAGTALNVVSSTVIDGTWKFVDSSGYLYAESTTQWLDTKAGTSRWFTASGQAQNVKMDGLQGYQRVWDVRLEGTAYTNADVTVAITTDYGEAGLTQTKTFTYSSDVANWATWEPRVHLTNQKCKAVSVAWSDATPTGGTVGSGRGFSLQGLRFDVGVVGRSNRVKSAQQG